jgi:hypothetical protein
VQNYGLHLVGPGEFDKEVVREIAANVALPPRLRASGKLAAIDVGLIGSDIRRSLICFYCALERTFISCNGLCEMALMGIRMGY